MKNRLAHVTSLRTKLLFIIIFISFQVHAELIDPEIYINKNGHTTKILGDTGRFYFYTNIRRLEYGDIYLHLNEIKDIYKNKRSNKEKAMLAEFCKLVRENLEDAGSKKYGMKIRTELVAYGNVGSTIMCATKYSFEEFSGVHLSYSKKTSNGMYQVFITD